MEEINLSPSFFYDLNSHLHYTKNELKLQILNFMKNSLETILIDIFVNHRLIDAIFSAPRQNALGRPKKIALRPLFLKNSLVYQVSRYVNQQVLHENISPEKANEMIEEWLKQFKQAVLFTSDKDYHLLVNKRGEVTVISKPPTKSPLPLAHNRKKRYLIEEGEAIPYLVELGLMTPSGRIVPQKRDKFRQVNRFLELIEDIVPVLQTSPEETLKIIDFGCGKASLTFALYDHLTRHHGLSVDILGLDLKADVVASCQQLADRLGYQHLRFQQGKIEDLASPGQIDLVVALHACDTATDAAIEKAVRWEAKAILAVPCCQHELFKQVRNEALFPLLHHGILKERFAALATDAARGQILEILGYQTQILEFIDLEHTPKNLLIRAVRRKVKTDSAKARKEYAAFKEALGISPALERFFARELSVGKGG